MLNHRQHYRCAHYSVACQQCKGYWSPLQHGCDGNASYSHQNTRPACHRPNRLTANCLIPTYFHAPDRAGLRASCNLHYTYSPDSEGENYSLD
ncbi:hypothetical protein BO86DRAFT_104850 [Aspergillus japonicus CBS 114.51]|uniref:Uncharacterized protein n=1 Tax=Aspergillus japonicus CBS 114.51 TaxID=1448312 RepID=A0A8T8X076_ASPJA|nr:hypothetical protein BO86DRAFT_104850 [Aspergillus japonicus CBS 114.51]RAH81032.1 hypothetical protein BO86DRAFT_104850 [Aspergillus japonicus CBS 114.51]